MSVTASFSVRSAGALFMVLGAAAGASGQCSGPWEATGAFGPVPRSNSAMAYDAGSGKILLFGGLDQNNFVILGDTWTYTAAGFAQAQVSPAPSARHSHAMAYDSGRGRVVLFGGFSAGVQGDTWEWNGTAWANVANSGPPARQSHRMAYDPVRAKTVLFGGQNASNAAMGDTWEFDGPTATWTQRMPAAAPSARYDHVMAFDVSRGRTVLFGGFTDLSGLNDETWEWNGTSWQPFLGSGPTARSGAAMVYDPGQSRMRLFGGGEFVFLNDTWERVGTTWTQVTTGGPAIRFLHAMAHDSGRGATVIFGGSNGNNSLGDTWEWRCGCYANCDGSTIAPILNVADFICFQSRYAGGSSYANCDGSTTPPVLNVNDFICFQGKYAAGCP